MTSGLQKFVLRIATYLTRTIWLNWSKLGSVSQMYRDTKNYIQNQWKEWMKGWGKVPDTWYHQSYFLCIIFLYLYHKNYIQCLFIIVSTESLWNRPWSSLIDQNSDSTFLHPALDNCSILVSLPLPSLFSEADTCSLLNSTECLWKSIRAPPSGFIHKLEVGAWILLVHSFLWCCEKIGAYLSQDQQLLT